MPRVSFISPNHPPSPRGQSQGSEVKVWVNDHRRPTRRRWWLNLLTVTTGLLGAGGCVGLFLWVSVVLILRPYPPAWVLELLPGFAQEWRQAPVQSLADIEAELQLQGQRAGELLSLATAGTDTRLETLHLLPIFEVRSPCSRFCREMVAVRLYRTNPNIPATEALELLDHLKVQGLPTAQLSNPVTQLDPAAIESTRVLPLSEIKFLRPAPDAGGWLTLTGRQEQKGIPTLYGQTLHVDPETLRIYSVLNWHSSVGRLPTWHNLDRAGLPELIVNQSTGLEPYFRAYTITHTTVMGPARLVEISLTPKSLSPVDQRRDYRQALFLAQRYLWSEALRQLTDTKAQLAEQWSAPLEQQLQLVKLHAQVSQNNAQRQWARPRQRLLALLLDGQWDKALQGLEGTDRTFAQATLSVLEQHSARLWQRLAASLQVQPDQKAARLWSALVLLAKENEKSALQWLSQTQQTSLTKEFEAIATRIQQPSSGTSLAGIPAQPSPPAENSAENSSVSLFGTAQQLDAVNVQDWQLPAGSTRLSQSAGEQWYALTLQARHQGQGWQTRFDLPPESSSEAIAAVWRSLGFDRNPTLSLIDPTRPNSSQVLQVHAVQWQGDEVKVLASGPAISAAAPWPVVTAGQWTTPQQGHAESLTAIYQNNPEIGDRLLTALSNHLNLDTTELFSAIRKAGNGSNWATVQWADFTGDQVVEALLTLNRDAAAQLGIPLSSSPQPTILMNLEGDVLYSSLPGGETQFLLGWIAPTSGETALVIQTGDTFRLLPWSSTRKHFISGS